MLLRLRPSPKGWCSCQCPPAAAFAGGAADPLVWTSSQAARPPTGCSRLANQQAAQAAAAASHSGHRLTAAPAVLPATPPAAAQLASSPAAQGLASRLGRQLADGDLALVGIKSELGLAAGALDHVLVAVACGGGWAGSTSWVLGWADRHAARASGWTAPAGACICTCKGRHKASIHSGAPPSPWRQSRRRHVNPHPLFYPTAETPFLCKATHAPATVRMSPK